MSVLCEVVDVKVDFGGLHALQGVSLEVEQGSIVGLIGPNGAGKTTLLNVISGLQRPTSGVVRYAGQDVTSWPADRRAKAGVRRSFQNLGLMDSESAGTNVTAAQHLAHRYSLLDLVFRPWRWLSSERTAQHACRATARTFEVDHLLDEKVADLSFGVARFVELVCVSAQRPRLMLLDEPTTGLDLAEVQRLVAALRRSRDDGTTIVVIAHDVRFVMEVCDYVYVLAEGAVLAHGDPTEVRANPDVVDAYLGRAR